MIKLTIFVFITILLSGCIYKDTIPTPPNQITLQQRQAQLLENSGFVLESDGWTLSIAERLLFDTDSFEVKESSKVMLIDLAQKLKLHRLNHIKVIGYTDNIGLENYSHQLSLKRAHAVANVLIGAGYDSTNLEIVGRGMSQPVFPNSSEVNRAENRRVSLIIVQE